MQIRSLLTASSGNEPKVLIEFTPEDVEELSRAMTAGSPGTTLSRFERLIDAARTVFQDGAQ